MQEVNDTDSNRRRHVEAGSKHATAKVLDLLEDSAMAGLVWDLLPPYHITKYSLPGLSEKRDCEYEIARPNIRNEDHDAPSIFIDKETRLSDNSPALYRRSEVVLAK